MSGPPAPDEAVWVITDMSPVTGDYFVAVQCSNDRTFAPADPVAYGMAVLRACEYADHDAAVFAQLTKKLSLPERDAGGIVARLRDDRPAIQDAATAPLRFTPIIAARDHSPQILVHYGDGVELTQWTPADARGHALYVLQSTIVVETDTAYRRFMRTAVNPGTAEAVVQDLANFRHNE